MIVEGLEPLAVDITTLKNLENNPRKGDVQSVMKSYEKFGQRKPIVAKKDGTVIAGNHQLEAAKALGWEKIAVVFVDDDDATAKAFALADNRTHDLGSYDDNSLAELLTELNEDLLDATGYSSTDIDEIIARATVDALPIKEEMEQEDEDRSRVLALANVAFGEPTHQVLTHQIYKLNEHYLAVCDVMRDWKIFSELLNKQGEKTLFMPYAGPYIALSTKLKNKRAVFVQPDLYLAGHILDKWAAVYGEESIERIA